MHWPARPSSSMSTIHVCRRFPRSRTLGWRHESRGRKGRILAEDHTDSGPGQETTTRASRIVRSSRHGNAAADANQRQIPSNWKLRNARKGRCQRRVSWVRCGEILAPLIAPRTRPGLHGSTGPSLQQGTSSTVSFDCRSRGERGGRAARGASPRSSNSNGYACFQSAVVSEECSGTEGIILLGNSH